MEGFWLMIYFCGRFTKTFMSDHQSKVCTSRDARTHITIQCDNLKQKFGSRIIFL